MVLLVVSHFVCKVYLLIIFTFLNCYFFYKITLLGTLLHKIKSLSAFAVILSLPRMLFPLYERLFAMNKHRWGQQ